LAVALERPHLVAPYLAAARGERPHDGLDIAQRIEDGSVVGQEYANRVALAHMRFQFQDAGTVEQREGQAVRGAQPPRGFVLGVGTAVGIEVKLAALKDEFRDADFAGKGLVRRDGAGVQACQRARRFRDLGGAGRRQEPEQPGQRSRQVAQGKE